MICIFESSALPHIKDPSFLFISTTHWSARFCMTHHGRTWKSLKINGSWPSKARQNEPKTSLRKITRGLHPSPSIDLHRHWTGELSLCWGCHIKFCQSDEDTHRLRRKSCASTGPPHLSCYGFVGQFNPWKTKRTPRPSQHKRRKDIIEDSILA